MPLSVCSLKNQREFDIVNKKAHKKIHSDYFILVLMRRFKNLSGKRVFIGMKVVKKLGNSVVRNKIKRRIRHLNQAIMTEYQEKIDGDAIIFIPKKNFQKVEFSKLFSTLRTSLRQYFKTSAHL